MKRILILTASIGGGHNSAASAVSESLKKQDDTVTTEIVDVLKECSDTAARLIYEKGYAASMSIAPGIYNAGYSLSKTMSETRKESPSIRHFASGMTEKLCSVIKIFGPDVIYCTHFFPAVAVSMLREEHSISCPVIASNLDYNITPYWNSALSIDLLTVAHPELIPECEKMGFDKSRIVVTGIPTREEFLEPLEKNAVRQKLGLRSDIFTVFVMFGGGDWAGTHKIVKDLISCGREMQIVVINGKNDKSRAAVSNMEIPDNIELVNLGYTSNVAEYMYASDIGITKAGGLSATEMINTGLPMIIKSSVYGQERLNLDFLMKHSACLCFGTSAELRQQLDINAGERETILQNMLSLKRNGSRNISELIMSQVKAYELI